MTIIRVALAVALCRVLDTAAVGQAADGQPLVVRGTVMNTLTGKPIRSAVVKLNGASREGGRSQQTETDAEGNFLFSDLEPGTYSVSASRAGYVQTDLNNPAQSPRSYASATVGPGVTPQPIKLDLLPHAAMTGRVVDPEGDPVEGATVQVAAFRWSQGTRELAPLGPYTVTNELGEFRLAGLRPGKVVIMVKPAQASQDPFTEVVTPRHGRRYVTSYHPATRNPNEASTFECHAGEEINGLTVRLVGAALARLRGRVVRSGTAQPIGAKLTLRPKDENFFEERPTRAATATSQNGQFEIADVLPGPYSLAARATDGETKLSGSILVTVGASPPPEVTITVSEYLPVHGVLKKPDGSPGGNTIQFWPAGGEWRGSTGQLTIGSSGAFNHPGLAPGDYWIDAQATLNECGVKSVMSGDEDITGRPLTLNKETSGRPLTVTMWPKCASAVIRVWTGDGQGLENVAVYLIPTNPAQQRASAIRMLTAGSSGLAIVSQIEPGKYTVAAVAGLERDRYPDEAVLKEHAQYLVPVELTADRRAEIDVKLKPRPLVRR